MFALRRTAGLQARAMARFMSTDSKDVCVVGSGLMGSGIAQVAAVAGYKVKLLDINDDVLNKASDRIRTSLARVAKKKCAGDEAKMKEYVDTAMGNLVPTTDIGEAVDRAHLVVEAVPEKIELKHKLFSDLDKAAAPETIFASNTSSLKIGEIAKVTDRLDRFGGLHFFNPVPVMKLVEVIRIPETSDQTFEALKAFGDGVGKHVVVCKDTPGFIVNRLLVPYMLEAVRMVERGDATKEDVDAAMKLGAGYPMGPFELLDYVGLDTTTFIADGWARDYPDVELFKPVKLMSDLVDQGKLGAKSGEGFYKHNK